MAAGELEKDTQQAETGTGAPTPTAPGQTGTQQPAAGTSTSSTSTQNETDEAKDNAVGPWHFRSLVVVLGALLLVLIAAFSFANGESVIGILGAVLPSFATIAAAVFGVKYVHDTAKAGGEATGKAEGEKGKEEAVQKAEADVAKRISRPLREADRRRPATGELIEQLRTGLDSPAGYNGLQLFGGTDAVVRLPNDLLERADNTPEITAALAIADGYIGAP